MEAFTCPRSEYELGRTKVTELQHGLIVRSFYCLGQELYVNFYVKGQIISTLLLI